MSERPSGGACPLLTGFHSDVLNKTAHQLWYSHKQTQLTYMDPSRLQRFARLAPGGPGDRPEAGGLGFPEGGQCQ